MASIAQALREILVDELHAHLYLKSFWCESRWAIYTPNQQACECECQCSQYILLTIPLSSKSRIRG
jgi:hypothetical protein